MLVEMLQSCNLKLVVRSIVMTHRQNSISRYEYVLISRENMILFDVNNERRNRTFTRANILNHSNSFSIARLNDFSFFTSFKICDNQLKSNHIHSEICFVEIVNILISNVVFRFHIAHQIESRTYLARIFIENSLTIVTSTSFRFQF